MLDPRGRRITPRSRREHWRAVILVVVVLVVCLAVGEIIDQVVKTSPSVGQRTDKTWAAAVATIVDESNTLSPTLHAIRAHATDSAVFNRVTLEFALEELARGTRSDASAYTSLDLAAPTLRAGALVTRVLNLRREGAENLARGVELAISRRTGQSPLPTAGRLLETAGSRFLAADAGYRTLVLSLHGDADARSLPPSVWVSSPSTWSAAAAGAWASALRSAASLAFAPALSIVAVTLEPPPLNITGLPTTTTTTLAPATTTSVPTTTSTTTTSIPTTTGSTTSSLPELTTTTTTLPAPTTTLQIPPAGSVSVVAATRRLEVVVIVENSGNAAVRSAYLTVALTPTRSSKSGVAGVSARHALVTLAPGGSQYVVMPKLAVRQATGYDLVVTASIPSGPSVQRSFEIYVSS